MARKIQYQNWFHSQLDEIRSGDAFSLGASPADLVSRPGMAGFQRDGQGKRGFLRLTLKHHGGPVRQLIKDPDGPIA